MHYCYNDSQMSEKNLYTFSPHPLSISQDMKAELQPFRRALCLFEGSASLFPGAAKVSEISGLPSDQEFMSLSSSFDLYLD